MKKSFKIFSVFLFVLVLMSVLLSVPVSALTVGGGATIEGTYGAVSYTQSDVVYSTQNGGYIDEPNDRRINFNIPMAPNPGSGIYQTQLQFTFNPGSFIYGKLTLFVTFIGSSEGLTGLAQYEGLRDRSTGQYISRPELVNNNKFKMEFTGYIPSKLETILFFRYSPSDPSMPSTGLMAIYDVTFQPIDKGSQDIIDNQNENADKIMNGWQGDTPSSGKNDDLASVESDLLDSTKDNSINTIADAYFSVSSGIMRLSNSFFAVSKIFDSMTDTIPDLKFLIYTSLLIGVVPLIVGMSISGLRQRDRVAASRSRSERYRNRKG